MGKPIKTLTADTFANFLSGLGIFGRDKTASAIYTYAPMNKLQLENAYRGDWIARKAIDIPPFDSTRQWRNWQADKDQIKLLEETEKKFSVQQKLQQAMVKARLYGGAALIIGVDGNQEAPLDPESIGKDGLKWLHVVSRWGLNAGRRIFDVGSEWYGEPEYYERTNFDTGGVKSIAANLRLHPSRVIRLNGLDHPDPEFAPEIWGDSVVQLIDDAVKQAGGVSGSIAALIAEAKVDILKIPELTEIMSTDEGTKKLVSRFQASNVAKSVINSLLIDANEEHDTRQLTFHGMPEVLQMYLLIACGAVDIPATRFLGQSPVGMNATGESDTRNYYDRLKSDQATRTTPVMAPLDEIIIRHTFGSRDPAIYYEWASLWQLSDSEKSVIAKTNAEATNLDATGGLIPESALAKGRQNQLIEAGTYPGLEVAIEEAEAAGEFSPHDPQAQVQAAQEEQQASQEQQSQQLQLAQAAIAAKTKPTGTVPKIIPFKKKTDSLADQIAELHNSVVIMKDSFRDLIAQVRSKSSVRDELDPVEPKMPPFKKDGIDDATELRTLYVRRDLVNTKEFFAWAKEQGFTDLVDDPHVTVLYSKEAVDWIAMGNDREFLCEGDDATDNMLIPAGGPRVIMPLGDMGAVVLCFASSRLSYRHQDMVYKGASHDYDEYSPHVTISYENTGLDLSKIEPYQGPLVFGPEIFQEISLEPRN